MIEERYLTEMPYDKVFEVGGNEEFCHATGKEVLIEGEWWNEYVSSDGELYYGR